MSWFPRPDPSAEHRLFCLPHGGGSASVYRTWRRDLAPVIDVVPAQLPGRETRYAEPAMTSADALVTAMIDPLLAGTPASFALFGHSMGALLAYEVAAATVARGRPPVRLFVSGHHPPHLPSPTRELHGLADEDFIAALLSYGGIPEELLEDPDMVAYLLPIFRADFAVCESYRHPRRRPLPVPVTVLAGRADPAVDVAQLPRWAELTTAETTVRLFEGGHFYHLGEESDAVLKTIVTDLTATS
ncbi:surfactin synthase thioesterase subunit [Micromonospora violae]|uniref:Surfactin synthase thioesterase subunit n=1 Tax=Micromonospora violae TaxID=1278207 RepID=A0A4Q7UHK5_9ACTN|nr:alpha/beta fold hydrolase [Micromonospora violae]RZT79751.1 surfactin synthase thioesterase subunit [Micromonospora violae]